MDHSPDQVEPKSFPRVRSGEPVEALAVAPRKAGPSSRSRGASSTLWTAQGRTDDAVLQCIDSGGLTLSELATEDCRLAGADREPDADAGAPGEEVAEVPGQRPLHAMQGDCAGLTAAGIPGMPETAADAHAEEAAV